MEMYLVIRAPMMSWTSEKKSRMINSSPQERDAKIGLGKKRFPFGITTAGARGSFAPRDLMLSVKLTKLVWKKKKVRLHLFIPFHFTAHLPSAYLDPSFLFLRIFFSLPPLPFLLFFFFWCWQGEQHGCLMPAVSLQGPCLSHLHCHIQQLQNIPQRTQKASGIELALQIQRGPLSLMEDRYRALRLVWASPSACWRVRSH